MTRPGIEPRSPGPLANTLTAGPMSRSASLMRSSLLLQQCPACLVRLIWIVFVMCGRWPYSCCFVGCCFQDLFNIARSILASLPSSLFSIRLVSVHVVHPYSSINTIAAWKKLRFILSVRSDFHMTDSLSIAVHALVSRDIDKHRQFGVKWPKKGWYTIKQNNQPTYLVNNQIAAAI